MPAIRESTKDWKSVPRGSTGISASDEVRGDSKGAFLRAAKRANRTEGIIKVDSGPSWSSYSTPPTPRRSARVFKDLISHDFHSKEFEKYSGIADQALNRIPEESSEAGHDTPPSSVIREARRIVRGMLRRWARDYDIYPMDERRVAVEVDGGFGKRMLLVCEDGGSTLCIVTVHRVSRRARYEDSRALPDGFVWDALRDMGHKSSAEPFAFRVTYAP